MDETRRLCSIRAGPEPRPGYWLSCAIAPRRRLSTDRGSPRTRRSGKHAEHFLRGFDGILQVDGYRLSPRLRARGGACALAACWSHSVREIAATPKVDHPSPKPSSRASPQASMQSRRRSWSCGPDKKRATNDHGRSSSNWRGSCASAARLSRAAMRKAIALSPQPLASPCFSTTPPRDGYQPRSKSNQAADSDAQE
jgi:hypothetical protein